MFGRKKPEPIVSPPPPPDPKTAPAPIVELSEELRRIHRFGDANFDLSDIDFSDPDAPKLKHNGEWKQLELYKTEATIVFTDITMRGGWYVGLHQLRPRDSNWYEMLRGTAHIRLPYNIPLLSFYDWGEDAADRRSSGARYSVIAAEFPDTTIVVNRDFDKNVLLADEDRPFEDHFYGSPVKLFRSSEEVDNWINPNVMAYYGDSFVYKEFIAEREGRPQQYVWPEVVFSRNEYQRYAEPEHHGFYGSQIQVPIDVYDGLRRAVVDFKEGARIRVRTEMEFYGVGINTYEYLPEPATADLTIIPRTAQLTGRIVEVTLEWDENVRPINTPSSFWTDPERD